jgi:hypothetical protein
MAAIQQQFTDSLNPIKSEIWQWKSAWVTATIRRQQSDGNNPTATIRRQQSDGNNPTATIRRGDSNNLQWSTATIRHGRR